MERSGNCRARCGDYRRRRGGGRRCDPPVHGTQFQVLLIIPAGETDPARYRSKKERKIENEVSVGPIWLAFCALQAQQPTQIAVTPPPATTPVPPPSGQPPKRRSLRACGRSSAWGVPTRSVPLTTTRLLRRCSITAICPAEARIRDIDVGKIDENVGKVMKQCAATPNVTVPQAFRDALRPRRSPG